MTRLVKMRDTFSFRITPVDREQILTLAAHQNVKVSVVIRELVANGLSNVATARGKAE